MLFNSYVFVFAFLPLSLLGFYAAAALGRRSAAFWLVFASIIFYGWWDPVFVALLLLSVTFNYGMSQLIGRAEGRESLQTGLLAFGVTANLAALVYFKYLFAILAFLANVGVLHSHIAPILLPLGISFFTFTQIGYLVDCKQGVAKDRGALNYLLFVTFFPHLIAGPILHNREIMPQFGDAATYRFSSANLSAGLSIFALGLLKKCLLADPSAAVVGPGFAHADQLTLFAAWNVALSYSLQLYFDFSGYSDMAIGLARMFNVRFPLNFNSPYKSASVIDYWQRWHMTLTRYITLYLYNPIALHVTRRRIARGLSVKRQSYATASGFLSMVAFPTFVTITLAGVWHGAGMQFLVFGLLHGVYLSFNHAWRIFGPGGRRRGQSATTPLGHHVFKVLLTYVCVLVASIFFRASSVPNALDLLAAMVGVHGVWAAFAVPIGFGGIVRNGGWLAVLYAIVWFMPNTQQIMRQAEPALGKIEGTSIRWLEWQRTKAWAIAFGCAAALGVLAIGGTTEFIYFQF